MKKYFILALVSLTLLGSCSSATEPGNRTETGIPTTEEDKDCVHNEVLHPQILSDNYRNYYEIFVASYADSDGDGTGDLNGIRAKLPEIENTGYTGIWLTPIFASTSYHKYDTDDYFRIASSFGTMDDLKALVKEAHQRNIKVILDGVFNHSSSANPWFEKALLAKRKEIRQETLTQEESNYVSLYTFYDTLDEAMASGKRYSKAGGNDFYYECNFSDTMPEFNFDSEFTYAKIREVMQYYLAPEIGIDGFRLDAVKYYAYGDNEKNVKILSRLNQMAKEINPDSYLVGECWDSDKVISQYYESGMDSFFYFPAAGSDSFLLRSSNNEGKLKGIYYRGALAMEEDAQRGIAAPFLDNHDMPRISFSENYLYQNKFTLGLLGMLSGTTFHYYGDEIGMNSTRKSNDNYEDSNYRTHYYWNDITHAMECHNVPNSLSQPQNYPAYDTQKNDPDSLLSYVKEVNTLRNSYPFLARGVMKDALSEQDQKLLDTSKANLLAIRKDYQGKTYKLVFNFSSMVEEEYPLTENEAVKYVLTADKKTIARLHGDILTLPSYAIAILGL